jgi:hypothetical protein
MSETTTAVRALPLLFSGEMVRALLAGTKTQTRRVIDPRTYVEIRHSDAEDSEPERVVNQSSAEFGAAMMEFGRRRYGAPGDRLWVRETWGCPRADAPGCPGGRKPQPGDRIVYRAEDADDYQWGRGASWSGWRSSRFMPRWASRITLEITDVRVRRVQEITRDDAFAEGIESVDPYVLRPGLPNGMPAVFRDYEGRADEWCAGPVESFKSLWNSLNAQRGYGWDSEPLGLVPHLPPGGGLMRALSLWQPHATLCCLLRPEPNPFRLAEKPFETRGAWAGRVPLGDVVIHAAKTSADLVSMLLRRALHRGAAGARLSWRPASMPLGAALGVVEVVAVWRTTECRPRPAAPHWYRRDRAGAADLPPHTLRFGDFSQGRTLLHLQNVRPLTAPLPMRGRQGLFTLTTDEEAAVRALLPTT